MPKLPGREFPGLIECIRIWFRDYKTPDGKPQNRFGFDDKPQNKEFTLQVQSTMPLLCVLLQLVLYPFLQLCVSLSGLKAGDLGR